MMETLAVEVSDQTVLPVKTQPSGSPDGPPLGGSRSRKRTKTGCLTCRKRRVKCGEERPMCANCVKSKRDCEGYQPRLTFKDPIGAYPDGWPVRGYHLPPGIDPQYFQHPNKGTNHPHFPLIAPRPLPRHEHYVNVQSSSQLSPQTPLGYSVPPYIPPVYPTSGPANSKYDSVHPKSQNYHSIDPSFQGQGLTTLTSDGVSATISSCGSIDTPRVSIGPTTYTSSIAQSLITPSYTGDTRLPPGFYPSVIQADSVHTLQSYESKVPEASLSQSSYIPVASHSSSAYQNLAVNGSQSVRYETSTQNRASQDYGHNQQHPAVAQLYEEEEEYYDVESDEEMLDIDDANISSVQKRRRDLSYVLSISGRRRDLRSVEAFLHQPNVLTTYTPRYSSSPLMDEATARIFCHFVTVTGPLMSAYGRHPVNPALLFSGTPIPKSQQALWTYTIPMMAISNQALLHAILAVASLNIARLQQAPLTVPIKHYQYALRRVAKAVATPGKRTAMATVAATILLSQFEILSAEHSKWHSHLAGARQLLTEIDFAHWIDRIDDERASRASVEDKSSYNRRTGTHEPVSSVEALPWIPEPGSTDEDVLNKISGTSMRKDLRGQRNESKPSQTHRPILEKELDDFQTYRDLFWMYTKIDNIQSFVSGRRLLLPLDRWIHCPPRAPINRFDAVYGTLDHVSLLIGRVADFAGKDVIRKRRVLKANGGSWRPSPGMFSLLGTMRSQRPPDSSDLPGKEAQVPSPSSTGSMPSTPGSGPPQPSSAQSQSNHVSAAPAFNGLFPDSEQTTNMPVAFTQAQRDILYQPATTDFNLDLNEATTIAEAEWINIQEAFDVFEQSLGSSFAPLSIDAGPAVDTAFGPALQYRTFQIATCWLLFYMAKVIAIRTHPSMPPASMVAAGVAAARTAHYCNIIGRINFGLQTPAPDQPLNPIFGGAITEMMLPMFVAGVQYVDNAQRLATVERLQFIADRIGHDSAALIAAGLEAIWIKMHDVGKGPKYTPSVRVQDEYGRDISDDQRNQPDATNGEIRVPRGPARDLAGRETSKNKNRGAVILLPDTRSFAAGVMGLDETFKGLNLDE